MEYNWPDRIKLVLVNIVLNTIIGIAIALLMLFQDIGKRYFTSLKQLFLVGILLSVLLTLPFFLKEWKKLRNQEKAGEFPDMQDMRNIAPRQMIFLVIGIPMLVTSFVVFQLYSKLAGVLCFILYLVIWGIETVYVRRRFKKINDGKSIK
jgi:membrane protease YdiL (CAAX protease family)